MMRRPRFCGLFVIALLALVPNLLAVGPSLAPGDVEKVTGLHNVHLLPSGTSSDCSARHPPVNCVVPGRDNYADGSGKIVLWFQEFTAPDFQRVKAQPAKRVEIGTSSIEVEPKLFHVAVLGLGDEAFDSPDGELQHALYVRKGQAAFGLIANVAASARGDRPTLTLDQLKALAKIVLSRMR